MRYAVVVSSPRNYASLFVMRATTAPGPSQLVAVVYCQGSTRARSRRETWKRRLRKIRRIGVLGALNGLRMRRWYGDMVADRLRCPPLEEACEQAGVSMMRVGSFADSAAHDRFRDLNLDIGLSLGNGMIPPEFFRIPRFGMLNVHHELLPEYRGAQTALWQLHDGSSTTGYSVHSITQRLDAGCILLREEVPIQWGRTLRDTVVDTTAAVQLRSVAGLLRLVADYTTYRERAMANTGRRVYTTPSARAMLRIYRNFLRLRRASADAAA